MTPNHEPNPFDTEAARYDAWFDAPDGELIFAQELACLRAHIGTLRGRWLEVGVGTGRFAEALGIEEGIDPSEAVLEFADRRGIRTRVGYGEDLPYPDDAFDGVLMVVTICFLRDPAKALMECRRVLKTGGRLVVGLVPADSPWGKHYARKARAGHRFYRVATFYTCTEVTELASEAGFTLDGASSCLLTPPETPATPPSVHEGIAADAGFVALGFTIG